MTKNEKIVYPILLIIFLFAFVNALSFPAKVKEFPLIMSGTGLVCIFIMVINGLVSKDKNKDVKKPDTDKKLGLSQVQIKSIVTIVLTIIYVVLISKVGYITSTFIYMIVLMSILKNEKKLMYLIITVIFLIIIYIVFIKLLYISLPKGLLF